MPTGRVVPPQVRAIVVPTLVHGTEHCSTVILRPLASLASRPPPEVLRVTDPKLSLPAARVSWLCGLAIQRG